MSFFQNTCKPSGLGGRLMVKMMNSGHAKLADWGFSQIQAKADARVLDAGCGGGANVAVWLKQCPKGRVTGMDYSEISVAETRKINDAAIKAGRCDVVQGNAAAMPFQAETFDVVSAFETVYFWPGLEACFAEVNRVMKRGGTFMICNECDGTNAADEKWQKMIDGMRIYPEEELRAALEKAGFTEIESRREKLWKAAPSTWAISVRARTSCASTAALPSLRSATSPTAMRSSAARASRRLKS